MTKSRKKKRRGQQQRAIVAQETPDLSIATFADAHTPGSGRLKKSQSGDFKSVNSNFVASSEEPPDNWSDIDDKEGENIEIRMAGKMSIKNGVKKKAKEVEDDYYSTYPFDFWLVLSDRIRPEQVCSFSLVCRQTLAITRSQAFWRRLYARYYRDDIELPARLQPGCMLRPKGLKPSVIRYFGILHSDKKGADCYLFIFQLQFQLIIYLFHFTQPLNVLFSRYLRQ